MPGGLLQGLPVLPAHRGARGRRAAVREPLHRDGEADQEVQGPEALLSLGQGGGGRDLLLQVRRSSGWFLGHTGVVLVDACIRSHDTVRA